MYIYIYIYISRIDICAYIYIYAHTLDIADHTLMIMIIIKHIIIVIVIVIIIIIIIYTSSSNNSNDNNSMHFKARELPGPSAAASTIHKNKFPDSRSLTDSSAQRRKSSISRVFQRSEEKARKLPGPVRRPPGVPGGVVEEDPACGYICICSYMCMYIHVYMYIYICI